MRNYYHQKVALSAMVKQVILYQATVPDVENCHQDL